MSTSIDPANLTIEHDDGTGDVNQSLDRSAFEPPAGYGVDEPRDLASGPTEGLYLPGNSLDGTDFFPTLEGLDEGESFQPASKRSKLSGSVGFIGHQLSLPQNVSDASLSDLQENSVLLMKLLSSTTDDSLGPNQAIYSALVGLASAGDTSRPTSGSSSTSTASALPTNNNASNPRKRPSPSRSGSQSGPSLLLGPELFSAVNPSTNNSTSLAAAVSTPTIGRSVKASQPPSIPTGKFAGAQNIPNDDVNGPVRVVRRVHGWVTILRNGGRQATGPYRQTVHQCVEDQKEVHRLRSERGMTNTEVMQLLEQMKHVTDRHPSTLLIKKPKKLDYIAPVGVRRMHKGFRASVRVSGREVYGPLRHDVTDASCDRQEMMKYRHAVDAPGMRAFVKTLRDRVYPHHLGGENTRVMPAAPVHNQVSDDGILSGLPSSIANMGHSHATPL